MNIALVLALVLIITIFLIFYYVIFGDAPVNTIDYKNTLLNRISKQLTWVDSTNKNQHIPYEFKIIGNNQLQITYFDQAGLINGLVTYIASYIVNDNYNITI